MLGTQELADAELRGEQVLTALWADAVVVDAELPGEETFDTGFRAQGCAGDEELRRGWQVHSCAGYEDCVRFQEGCELVLSCGLEVVGYVGYVVVVSVVSCRSCLPITFYHNERSFNAAKHEIH